jgi:protoheme IX farnesyltransferase
MGWLYGVPAAAGSLWFLSRSLQLVKAPSRATAMASFHASLLQLALLLAGVFAERWLGGPA